MSLTTRQLVDMMNYPCREGRDFADAHPDPEEAIAYALGHAELDPMQTTSMGYGPRACRDPGTFLRWAASELVVNNIGAYDALGDWMEDVTTHLEGCARILREWVAKVQAEHAEEVRS